MPYWLMKSEPSAFSIQDLQKVPRQTTCWDGVRNFQARNFMRAMKTGDRVLFYHSNAEPMATASGASSDASIMTAAGPRSPASDRMHRPGPGSKCRRRRNWGQGAGAGSSRSR